MHVIIPAASKEIDLQTKRSPRLFRRNFMESNVAINVRMLYRL